MKTTLLSICLLAASFSAASAQALITQWNFNGNSTVASVGTGTVSMLGGATTTGYNSGSGSSDPTQPGSGFQTTTYPAQSTNSGTAGVRFDVSTLGYSSPAYTGLNLAFDLRISNTSSRWFRLDYTTDGSNWNLGTPVRLGVAANAGDTWFNNNAVSLTDPAALNNTNFGFRVVSVFSPVGFTEASSSTSYGANAAYEVARNTTSNYGGGTWRFDMVTVQAVPEPGVWLLVTAGLVTLVIFRRRRSVV